MPLSIAGRPEPAQAVAVIRAVLDAGVNLLDTADVYCLDDGDLGHNERLIAAALKGRDRSGVIVATKAGLTRPGGRWERDGRPAHIRRACEASLRALETERIDLYQFHAPDPGVPFLESVGAFADLQREGKFRWFGLSNVSVEQIDAASRLLPVVTVQNRLNPFFREALDRNVVAHCASRGIGFLAYSPVGGGRLNLRLPRHPVVAAMAQGHGVSTHAVVLAWVRAQGATVIPIPGARTTAHALDSLTAAALTLSRDELAAIDAAAFPT